MEEMNEIVLKKSSINHWQIILNRPSKLNALTIPMYLQLIEILQRAKEDPQLILLSIRGEGKYFCSGTDLTNPLKMNSTEQTIEDKLNDAEHLLRKFIVALIEFPKLLIGFINGPSMGIAVSMLCLFDGVYGSSRSTYQLPFTKTGQSPECCSSFTIPSIMGFIHGKEFLLFNRQLNAEEALQRGLINEILPDEQFEEKIEEISSRILSLPHQSLLQSKELIQQPLRTFLRQINEKELHLLKERWNSEEFIQIILSFQQKTFSKL